jgi:hypothetical protein
VRVVASLRKNVFTTEAQSHRGPTEKKGRVEEEVTEGMEGRTERGKEEEDLAADERGSAQMGEDESSEPYSGRGALIGCGRVVVRVRARPAPRFPEVGTVFLGPKLC